MKREDIKIGNKYRVIGMSGNFSGVTTHFFKIGAVVKCMSYWPHNTADVDCEDDTGLEQLVNPCDLEPI